MPFSFKDFGYAVGLSAILVAVLLLAMGINQLLLEPMRKKRKIDNRLKGSEEYLRRIQILRERSGEQFSFSMGLLQKLLGPMRYRELQKLMLQADLFQDPGKFWSQAFLVDLIVFILFSWFARSLLVGFLVALFFSVLPYVYLKRKKRVKASKVELQMPDAMELMARSLRAGHTLPAAIALVGEEMDDPISTEMNIAYEEQKYGISVSDSLVHMLERVDSIDLRYFVAAVLIQEETGGNIAELMGNIARMIRSRLNLKAKIAGFTASGRISAFIMVITPVLAFIILMIIAPYYETILIQHPTGQIMLLIGILAALTGSYLLRRMIRALEL